jgi:hypothetical protein
MQRSVWILALLCVPADFGRSAPALKSAQEEAEAILDKAIQANGGEEKLAKQHTLTMRFSVERFGPRAELLTGSGGTLTLSVRGLLGTPGNSDWAHSLVWLKTKRYKMAPLGNSRIDDRPVVGIKVSPGTGRELRLYFDRETNLLLKREERTTFLMLGVDLVEILYEDYCGSEFKYPSRITRSRNETKECEILIADFKSEEEEKPSKCIWD